MFLLSTHIGQLLHVPNQWNINNNNHAPTKFSMYFILKRVLNVVHSKPYRNFMNEFVSAWNNETTWIPNWHMRIIFAKQRRTFSNPADRVRTMSYLSKFISLPVVSNTPER